MEDSLELPEDLDQVNIQTMLSPEQNGKTSIENTPRHSLAYSNSTCAKDKHGDIHFRSPLAFQNKQSQSPSQLKSFKHNNENLAYNSQQLGQNLTKNIEQSHPNLIVRKDGEKVLPRGQYKKVNPKIKGVIKSPNKSQRHQQPQQQATIKEKTIVVKEHLIQQISQISQRKTIDKSETFKLKQRLKELEQALHMETVISEQLRTKLSVVTSLLEAKLKDHGLQFFFDLKNRSRDLKNIDIFVQMNLLQKNMTEKNIILQRQKNQIKEMKVQIDRLRSKKTQTPPSKITNPNSQLVDELQRLREEKEELFGYIEQQRDTMTRKIAYIAELQQEINRMGDTESHYINVQRPKLLQQMAELNAKNTKREEDTQQLRMEHTLMEIQAKQYNQRLKLSCHQLQKRVHIQQQELEKISNSKDLVAAKTYESVPIQKDDVDRQIIEKELSILKSERDYYLSQYRKRTNQSAELYALQLKVKTLCQRQGNTKTIEY